MYRQFIIHKAQSSLSTPVDLIFRQSSRYMSAVQRPSRILPWAISRPELDLLLHRSHRGRRLPIPTSFALEARAK